jgi:hypothetical protein
LRRSPGTAGAVIASAAVLTLATVVCSIAFQFHLGWPPAVVPRLDLVPTPPDRWGAPWEALARPPSVYQREALIALIMTTAQLGAGTAVIALLSLVMHGAGRILAEWRSLAIRCALGARLRHLMGLVAGELCVLGTIGCGLGAIAGAGVAAGLRATWPALLTSPGQFLPAAGGAVTVLVVVLGVLAGVALLLLYPLQRGVRTVADLHGDHITTSGGLLLVQNILAMLQLAGLLVVSYGSLLILRSAAAADAAGSLPYRPRTVAVSRVSAGDTSIGVRASTDAWVGLSKELPLVAFCGDCFIGNMLVPMTSAAVRVVAVAPGALHAMSVSMLRGREFARSDRPGAPRVALLSHAASAQLFPGAEAIGRSVRTGFGPSSEYAIVGVSQDIAPSGLGMNGAALPILYVALDQHAPHAIEVAVANFSRETPRGFTSLARRFETLQAPLRWFAAIFALLALAATGLGVFALATAMNEMVALRRRDIAIRLALGAEPRHIVTWIVGQALAITGVGVVVGLSGARWLGDELSRHLSASLIGDLYSLAVLCLAFGVVGLMASWRPARRASRVQPAAVFADPAS